MLQLRRIKYILVVLSLFCVYSIEDGTTATFDGQSRVSYDVTCGAEFRQTEESYLALRFRTTQANGVIMYSSGYLGDYILLELVKSRLSLTVNLGSTVALLGATIMKAGSLLDDDQWHEVVIDRSGREVNLTVDDVTSTYYTKGSFIHLDLDTDIHFGGLDSFLNPVKPTLSFQNFTGCLADLWFGSINIIQGVKNRESCLTSHGAVALGNCQMESQLVFNFPSPESYITVGREHRKHMVIQFEFRSFTADGVLYVHQLMPSGQLTLKIEENGTLFYTIGNGDDYVLADTIVSVQHNKGEEVLTDGLWHSVKLEVGSADYFAEGILQITVDRKTIYVKHDLEFSTTTDHYIGGADSMVTSDPGFIGCIRNLEIHDEPVREIDSERNFGVGEGLCSVEDRCEPNPCEHGGICSQDHTTFTCDCGHTGYSGSTCHRSKYPMSCVDARRPYRGLWEVQTWLDLDGSGILDPFEVTCYFTPDVKTVIHHDSEKPTLVDGCQKPGCYRRYVRYGNMVTEQFDALTERSSDCRQYIKYKCHNARLLSDPGEILIYQWSWWAGRTGNPMDYWGGASPGSKMCACGVKDECHHYNPICNCDEGLQEDDIFDDGFLTYKEDLPVTELRFGDTGVLGDSKWGEHTLGPLECFGDTLFDNVITVRKPDAALSLPTFTLGDVQFHFKTTQEAGIIIQSKGPVHFIEVRLAGEKSIQFNFNIGDGRRTVEREMLSPLNDDSWHTVYMEINRKQAILQVDQEDPSYLDIHLQKESFRLDLSSPLMVGAAVDYTEGYVGCIRGLMVNGAIMDLKGMVEQGEETYGLSTGCQTKCSSNPCFHGGECVEFYSHYTCDCTKTSLSGRDCGREVGLHLSFEDMIKLELDEQKQESTNTEEVYVVGFSTLGKLGMLMGIYNGDPDSPEYITIEMNNNGGVKVALDVGFERDELNTAIPGVDLANRQPHVVEVRRYNEGRSMSLAVDDYPKTEKHWNLPPYADTKLDTPKYLYIGRSDYTRPGDGFKGCIFRAEFNGMYPLKEFFANQNGSKFTVDMPGNPPWEVTCTVEELLNPPDDPEYPPIRTTESPTTQTTPDSDSSVISGAPVWIACKTLFLVVIAVIFWPA